MPGIRITCGCGRIVAFRILIPDPAKIMEPQYTQRNRENVGAKTRQAKPDFHVRVKPGISIKARLPESSHICPPVKDLRLIKFIAPCIDTSPSAQSKYQSPRILKRMIEGHGTVKTRERFPAVKGFHRTPQNATMETPSRNYRIIPLFEIELPGYAAIVVVIFKDIVG